MSDSDLYTIWVISLAIAVVIVLIAAVLLLVILSTARSILANARAARRAVEAIAEQTQAIWGLDQTNEIASETLDLATSLEARGERVVTVLHAPEPTGRPEVVNE
jgi:uncharacterized protein YoxC